MTIAQLIRAKYQELRRLIPNANKKIMEKLIQGLRDFGASQELAIEDRYVGFDVRITKNDYKNLDYFYSLNSRKFTETNKGLLPLPQLLADIERIVDDYSQSQRSVHETSFVEDRATNASIIHPDGADEHQQDLILGVNEGNGNIHDHEYLLPHKDCQLRNVRKNFETFAKAKFLYNKDVPHYNALRTTTSKVQHTTILIGINAIDHIEDFIVSKSIVCPRCGNTVHIPVEEKIGSSSIRCDRLLVTGEPCRQNITLRDFEKMAGTEESKTLFVYGGTVFLGSEESPEEKSWTIKSFCRLRAGYNKVNLIYENGTCYVLSRDYPDYRPLFSLTDVDNQIVPAHLPKTRLFKLLYCLKDFLKTEYKLDVLNRGELLQAHILLSSILRHRTDYRDYHIMVFGDTGVAKTTPTKIWSNLCYETVKVSIGGSVTEANILADGSHDPPAPGDLAKYSFVLYDESAPAFELAQGTATDYKKALVPNLKNFLLERRITRDIRSGFNQARLANVVLLGNFLPSHLTALKEELRKEYNRLRVPSAKEDQQYNSPEYNFDEAWPVLISNPEAFANYYDNPFLASAYKQLYTRFKEERRDIATGAEEAFIRRFTFFVAVDNVFSAYDYSGDISDPYIEQKIERLQLEKPYYRFFQTLKSEVPVFDFTHADDEALRDYIYEEFAPKHRLPMDDRQQRLLTAALKGIMLLEHTNQVTDAVKDTFERLFRHNYQVVSQDLYNMEDTKDVAKKEQAIQLLVLGEDPTKNKERVLELIADVDWRDSLNKLIREKFMEKTMAGYATTELGAARLQELSEEKVSIKNELKEKSQKSTKDSDYDFDGMDQFEL